MGVQLAFGLVGLTVPLWSCPGRHLQCIGMLKLAGALVIFEPLHVMLRAGLWNTVSVGLESTSLWNPQAKSISAQYHANGHAFWFEDFIDS